MDRFREFLEVNAKPGCAVVSYHFDIPGWGRRLTTEMDGLRLYEVPAEEEQAKGAK